MPNNNPQTETISPDGILIPQPQQTIKAAPTAPEVTSITELPKEDNQPIVEPSVEDKKPLVTIDDFLAAKGDENIVPKPKVETNEQKVKEATLEKETPKEIKQAEPSADLAKTKVVEKDGRDYSDIPEEEKPLWRKMSNDSFNKILPQVKELKTLKEVLKKNEEIIANNAIQLEEARKGIVRIPDNYNEHPAAFVLTPEFKTVSNNVNVAQAVYTHWENQLLAVEEGASEITMLGNDANGNIIETGAQKVDNKTKLSLQRLISGSERQLANEQGKLQAMAQQHGQKAAEVKNWVTGHERDTFPIFEIPENKAKMAPVIKDTIAAFPPALQSNSLMPSYAKALVTINTLYNLLNAAKQAQLSASTNGSPGTNGNKEIAKRNGPSAGEIAGSGGDATLNKTAAQKVTLEDFKRAKEGEL